MRVKGSRGAERATLKCQTLESKLGNPAQEGDVCEEQRGRREQGVTEGGRNSMFSAQGEVDSIKGRKFVVSEKERIILRYILYSAVATPSRVLLGASCHRHMCQSGPLLKRGIVRPQT